jgi:hypothetical protein
MIKTAIIGTSVSGETVTATTRPGEAMTETIAATCKSGIAP